MFEALEDLFSAAVAACDERPTRWPGRCHILPLLGRTAYSLRRWDALGAILRDGDVAIENNHIENEMRPLAMGRKAWLFAGSELAGKLAAMV